MIRTWSFLAALLLLAACLQTDTERQMESESYVVQNAMIWTGKPLLPWALAMVVTGDTIAYVGSPSAARRLAGDAPTIDAGGQLIVPGFIDAHVHFLTGGANLSSVQLRDAASPQDFISRIAAFADSLEPGTWITGGDWDHTGWGGTLPERSWIDSVTVNNPVWVNRLDGHMALANSAALEEAGVPASPGHIPGGEVVRNESGTMTGILKDNAMRLVARAVPDPTPDQVRRALASASAYVARQGVTSVHDVDGWSSLEEYEAARASGELVTRIYACAPLSRAQELARHIAENGVGDSWIRTGCVKGFMDGSLGSHTAAFFEPYDDTPNDRGFLVGSEQNLERLMRAADEAGLQLAIHAIGDRAINVLLNIFSRIVSDYGPRDRRLRIEHAQHIAPSDFDRFSDLGVIPSMQPYHAIDDGRWAEEIIGPERSKTTYAFRSLIDAGAHPAFGSDWFVAPPTPLEGIYAAVTRRTLDDENPEGWVPEQKISVEEALRAYTIDAARASFEEDVKGTLETGKLADFVILDRDITRIPPEEIRDTQVVMTVVGGRVVYRRDL